jgi:t-SNARE complex subunit (syntaxin)
LFVDMATLVDVQDDHLRVIDGHIQSIKVHTEDAATSLGDAEKHQGAARKKSCIILAIVMGVLLVILIPTIATTVGKA